MRTLIARFFSWRAGISLLVASAGTFPCCGGPPCARGVVILGALGGIFQSF